ncbi:MAG TPA: VWA domain-containing protein [Spirochaetia bacterium]|nr:VWA domain-containing protein [Spirochaetia bacterium]
MKKNVTTDTVQGDAEVLLRVEAERKLIRPGGSARHIDISVKAPESRKEAARAPLGLALVIDRSGSMQGSKLQTAKAATIAVIERLTAEDTASVVIFDSEVETLLPEGRMTDARKAEARRLIAQVEARSATALHEGWLTGCRSIAAESSAAGEINRLGRCFLLTDGLANEGLLDAEQIAAQAADIRRNALVSTSTFGIGDDYDEALIAPMAVAGNGQFHHLRDEADILSTFSGELNEMFDVTARGVRIEIDADSAVTPELVSMYWSGTQGKFGPFRIDIGDLISGEERHIVARLHFGRIAAAARVAVKVRALWRNGYEEIAGPWQELMFEGADDATCDAERQNMQVMHWVGLHHAEKVRADSLPLYRNGNAEQAEKSIGAVVRRMRRYASEDPDLVSVVKELEELSSTYRENRMTQRMAKETLYKSATNSRMQRDHRNQQGDSPA